MKGKAGGSVPCVPASDHRRDHIATSDVREYVLLEIEHFLSVYKDLEPGKSVEAAPRFARMKPRRRFGRASHAPRNIPVMTRRSCWAG
jgi:hypothetical protein